MERDLVQNRIEIEKLKEYILTLISEQKCSTVKELVKKSKLDINTIRTILAELEAENKIELYDDYSLLDYLSSIKSVPFWTVLSTILITLASIYLIPTESSFSLVRSIIGSIFIFLPSYSIISALFIRKANSLTIIVLGLGLSLILIPLEVLLLDSFDSINLNSMIMLSSIISITAISISVYRSYKR
ncbi:MAG: hypothetical protein KatS3mg003_1188 [Candidatus Nitrosocaldaceae archaeon]|nr:MAG: hypothetical protein KatS3mg003_1188 [Candidatus Nitrosocaldaceae archaeon]